jgi:hypothetical protein
MTLFLKTAMLSTEWLKEVVLAPYFFCFMYPNYMTLLTVTYPLLMDILMKSNFMYPFARIMELIQKVPLPHWKMVFLMFVLGCCLTN